MPEEKKKLGEILLEAGVIDKFQLKSALAEQNKWGGRLGNHLVQMGTLSEDLLVKALSKQLKIPNLDLAQMMVTPDVLELVPHEIAEKFHLVPVAVKKIASKRTLIVAMSDPTNLDAIDELQFRTGHIIKPAVAGDTAIELAIRRYYYGELGPQRVAGQPIEFDAASAQAPPEVTNVPTADVPVPPENTFMLGEDEAPAAPQPVAQPAPPAPAAEEIPEASLADLGMDAPEATQADPQFAPTTESGVWPPAATAGTAEPAWPAPAATEPVWPAPAEAEAASVEPEPHYDASAAPPAEPEPYYDPNAAPAVEPEPYYDPNAAPPAEPEPYYDPNAAPAVEPDPAYAEAPAWSGEPTVADPGYAAEPATETAEPTYADAPLEAMEPAPEEPPPVPSEGDPSMAADATDAPAWNGGEAPYPPEEPTVPADETYETAVTAESSAQQPAPVEWAEPAPSAVEAWAEPAPAEAPVEPVAAEAQTEPVAEDPVWAEAEPVAAAAEELPVSPAMSSGAELSVAGESSVDSMPLEPVEPGPAEAEVDRMDAVPSSWNAGDAVQTFQGTSDGHPYEPTTPGEPTHAPDDVGTGEPALAADGGEPLAATESQPYDESANGNGVAGDTVPAYSVPADPLGGIPYETAEGRAIRALCALLLEKGLLTADELASRLRTAIEGTGGGENGGEGLG